MISFTEGNYHFINVKETASLSRYWNIAHVYRAPIPVTSLTSLTGLSNYTVIFDDEAAAVIGQESGGQRSNGEPGVSGVIFVTEHWVGIAYSESMYKAFAKPYVSEGVQRDPSGYTDAFALVIEEGLTALDKSRFPTDLSCILPSRSYSNAIARRFGILPSMGCVPTSKGVVAAYNSDLQIGGIDADYLVYQGSELKAAYGLRKIRNYSLPAPRVWNDDEVEALGRLLGRGLCVSDDTLPGVVDGKPCGYAQTENDYEALVQWMEAVRSHTSVDLAKYFSLAIAPESSAYKVDVTIKSAILPSDMIVEAWQQLKGLLVSEETLATSLSTVDLLSLEDLNAGVGVDLCLVDDDFAAILAEFQAKYNEYRVKIFRATLDQLNMMATDVCAKIGNEVSRRLFEVAYDQDRRKKLRELISSVNKVSGMDVSQSWENGPFIFEQSIFGTYASPKNPFYFTRAAIPFLNIADAQSLEAMKEEVVRKLPFYLDSTKRSADGRLLFENTEEYLTRSNPSHRSGLIFKKDLADTMKCHFVDNAGQRFFLRNGGLVADTWDGVYVGTYHGTDTFECVLDGRETFKIRPRRSTDGADTDSSWVYEDEQGVISSLWSTVPFGDTGEAKESCDYGDFAVDPLNYHIATDVANYVAEAFGSALDTIVASMRELCLGSGVSGMDDKVNDLDDESFKILFKKLGTYQVSKHRFILCSAVISVTGRCSICVDFNGEANFIKQARTHDTSVSKVYSENAAVLRRGVGTLSTGARRYTFRGAARTVDVPSVINRGGEGIGKAWGPTVLMALGGAAIAGGAVLAAAVNPLAGAIVGAVGLALLVGGLIWNFFNGLKWSKMPSSFFTVRWTASDLSLDLTALINGSATTLGVLGAEALDFVSLLSSSAAEMAYRAVRPLLDSIKKQGASESLVTYFSRIYSTVETMYKIAHIDPDYAGTILCMVRELQQSMGSDAGVAETMNRFTKFATTLEQICANTAHTPVYYLAPGEYHPVAWVADRRAVGAALLCRRR